MTLRLKSFAVAAALAAQLLSSTAAYSGSAPVDTPDPPPTVPALVTLSPVAVAAIASFAESAGLGDLAETLSEAEPGSPEATTAVLAIVTAIASANVPALTPSQAAAARTALEKIISATGGSPALTALMAQL